jgi:hypothetical protein
MEPEPRLQARANASFLNGAMTSKRLTSTADKASEDKIALLEQIDCNGFHVVCRDRQLPTRSLLPISQRCIVARSASDVDSTCRPSIDD